jgi:hypothetical protein
MFEPDTRSTAGTDYEGEPYPGLDTRINKWYSGMAYGAGVNLSALRGNIDLVARLKVWIFRKTFRKNLAKFKGFSKSFNFYGTYDFGGSGSKPIASEAAYGTMATPFKFPKLSLLTSADISNNPDPSKLFPLTVAKDAQCIF